MMLRKPLASLIIVGLSMGLVVFLCNGSLVDPRSSDPPRIKVDWKKTTYVDGITTGMGPNEVRAIQPLPFKVTSNDGIWWRTGWLEIGFCDQYDHGPGRPKPGTVWWVTGHKLTQDGGMLLSCGDTNEQMLDALGKPTDDNEMEFSEGHSYNYRDVIADGSAIFVGIVDGKVGWISITR